MALMSCFCAAVAKVAVTLAVWPLEAVSWQVVPVHAPLKPAKVDPEAGLAVRVTLLPLVNPALQVVGQLMPAGVLVTVPLPEMETVTCAEEALKVAETDWLLESTKLQVWPLQAPPKPAN
ncbi:MAG TPA: hypothetical protein VKR26_10900 [Terriglobales bacterium]|nr:hypothetical protein [Terriglobales bacterium]